MKEFGIKGQLSKNRRLRRAVVLGTYGGYAAMVSLWSLSSTLGVGWLGDAAAPFGFVALLSYFALTTSTYGKIVNEWKEARLDEREQQVRNRAHFVAYAILGVLVMTVALYGYIAADSGSLWLPTTENELQAVFWGVLLVASSLPAAVLAWLEPNPITDEMWDEAYTKGKAA